MYDPSFSQFDCSSNCGNELQRYNGRLMKDLDEGDDGITEARDGRADDGRL